MDAVANIKYNILGTPFFEQYVKSLDIENMTLHFKNSISSSSNTIPFAAQKEKDYPSFSYNYTIRVSEKLNFPPNSSKTVHFPIQSSSTLTFKTSDNETILTSPPHPFFHKRLNSTFNFLQTHDPHNHFHIVLLSYRTSQTIPLLFVLVVLAISNFPLLLNLLLHIMFMILTLSCTLFLIHTTLL